MSEHDEHGQEWILDLLRVMADDKHTDDCCVEQLWWRRADDGALRVSMNCSDIFAWGCADAEPIAPEDVPDIECARDEVRAIVATFPAGRDAEKGDERWLDSHHWPELWVARKRAMRPQGAFLAKYVKSVEVQQLFADAGPQRQGGVLGDPVHFERAAGA